MLLFFVDGSVGVGAGGDGHVGIVVLDLVKK